MNAKIRILALLAFSLIGCAATLPVVSPTASNPNPELVSELFYQHSVIRHDVMKIQDWNGDLEAIAAEVAKGWHAKGVYTDFQQESRNGTRVSFSAHKQNGTHRYKVIVQELSREHGLVLVVYAAWPSDLDDSFSKQFEIEVDQIIKQMAAPRRSPAQTGAITI